MVCKAYRDVDAATSEPQNEPNLWLPAAWLAVVLMLSASVPAYGGDTSGMETSGWKSSTPANSNASNHRVTTRKVATSHFANQTIYTEPSSNSSGWATTSGSVVSANARLSRNDNQLLMVDYKDDIAGPALRIARRTKPQGYRVAQQASDGFSDELQQAIERPFGVQEKVAPPMMEENSGDLFEDMPADPFEEEEKSTRSIMDNERTVPTDTGGYQGDYEEAPAEPESIPAPRKLSPKVQKANEESEVDCAESLASLRAKRLDTIDLTITISGNEGEDYPYLCSVDDGSLFAPRCWAEVTYNWKASALCHKPLYFEDVHLERYGHSWGPVMQPIVSGAHFFGRIPVLPYCMGLKAPNECVYTLGHYRPGNCAPYMIDPVPFTWRAAFMQAGATVGVAAILP